MAVDGHDDEPLDEADQEIGAEIADESVSLITILSDYYRGEVNNANNSQNRIDQSTNWAITVLAAVLSVVFASRDMPAYLLLIGVLAMCIFLVYEIRRYRFFDLYRARVRFFQENVYANALDPTGVEHPRWRQELGDDLRFPTFKVTVQEALARRIRRIYGLLFAVLGVAWVAKVTLFTPETQWDEAAQVAVVQGDAVAGLLAAFYLALVVIAVWPGGRQAKGEIYGEDPGGWKQDGDEERGRT